MVLTAKHVVEGSTADVTVEYPWGRGSVQGEVFAVDKTDADLAAISITADDKTPFVPIADKSPVVGTPIWQVGYPRTRGPFGAHGAIEYYSGSTVVYLTAIVDSGDSGSGAFVVKDKTLVAVISAKRVKTGGPAVAVQLASVQRFVNACLPRFRLLKPCPPKPPTPGPGPGVQPKPIEPDPLIDSAKKLEELHKKLEDMNKEWKDSARPGPAGPSGPKGDQGPQGPPGPKSDPGKATIDASLKAEIAELRAEMEKLKNLSGTFRIKINPKQ